MQNVGMAKMLNVGLIYNSNVGGKRLEITGASKSEIVTADRTASVKNDTVKVEEKLEVAARKIVLNASEEILLSCGSSSIRLTPTLIRILADMVKINC